MDRSKYIKQLITLGIISYLVLYLYASSLYPGGSNADPNSHGFSWVHNYWCNLMNPIAINGDPNPAKNYAIFAWFILCASIMLFTVRFGQLITPNRFWKKLTIGSGILTLSIALFLFTPQHDLVTSLSSLTGIVLFICLTYSFVRKKDFFLLFGYFIGVGFILLNNFVYYSSVFLEYLPVIQKISFGWILIFMLYTNRHMEQLANKSFP